MDLGLSTEGKRPCKLLPHVVGVRDGLRLVVGEHWLGNEKIHRLTSQKRYRSQRLGRKLCIRSIRSLHRNGRGDGLPIGGRRVPRRCRLVFRTDWFSILGRYYVKSSQIFYDPSVSVPKYIYTNIMSANRPSSVRLLFCKLNKIMKTPKKCNLEPFLSRI